MKTYIYILKLSQRLFDEDAWLEEDEQAVNNHFLRLKEDFEKGKVLHVGRTVNPTNDGFGMVVFKAENDEQAIEYMNSDPAVIGKQMTGICKEYKHIF